MMIMISFLQHELISLLKTLKSTLLMVVSVIENHSNGMGFVILSTNTTIFKSNFNLNPKILIFKKEDF